MPIPCSLFLVPQGHQFNSLLDGDGFSNSPALSHDAFDNIRGDDVLVTNLKLTKTFHMGGRTKVEIAAELFNALNENTILARELNLASSLVEEPREVLSPRLGRFSASIHF